MLAKQFATESGHWYTKDGLPAYSMKGKNGNERQTTLRDAKKLGLVPSVTTILSVVNKPALEAWKQRQIVLASLTLPKLDGEPLDDFAVRVIQDSKEQGRKRAEQGSAIHGSIEKSFTGPYPIEHIAFVNAVRLELENIGTDWFPEKSFSSPLGYGGKVDLHNKDFVIDFKTKEFSEEDDKLAWPEHAAQLSAYREGLGLPKARCLNIFISVNNPGLIKTVEWPETDLIKGFEKFKLLLKYWKIDKGII